MRYVVRGMRYMFSGASCVACSPHCATFRATLMLSGVARRGTAWCVVVWCVHVAAHAGCGQGHVCILPIN